MPLLEVVHVKKVEAAVRTKAPTAASLYGDQPELGLREPATTDRLNTNNNKHDAEGADDQQPPLKCFGMGLLWREFNLFAGHL